jgi:hypothetical protein
VKTYTLKGPGHVAQAKEADRKATSEALSFAGYTGGAIVNQAQLVTLLHAKAKAQKLLKAFDAAAKDWVREHGPVEGDDGRTWGPVEVRREARVSITIEALIALCVDLGIPQKHITALVSSLRDQGAGAVSISYQFRWTK